MALDFPSLPAVGQKYPQPPITGVPVYSWDGEKWTTYGGLLTPSGPADALPLMDATPAAVGTSMEYAREDHVHPTDTSRAPLDSPVLTGNPQAPTPAAADADTSIATTAFVTSAVGTAVGTLPTSYVRYDTPQTLTSPQLIQARSNIYAAPFDALAYNGMQINGSMEVSQELGTTGTTIDSKYVCDGWIMFARGTAVMTGAQAVVTVAVAGMSNYLYASVTTAQATLTGTQFNAFVQPIDGYRVSRLAWGTANARPLTIAFWCAHNLPGIYSISVRNSDDTRSFTTTYTQNVSNTWEYKTVTIPGDTAGTWLTTNNIGMRINFVMACGPTYIAPAANTWYGATYIAAPGQVNAVAVTTEVFRITGVVVLPGTQAPSAAQSPFIMRPFTDELQACQRYYEKTYPYADKPGSVYGNYAGGGAIGFQNAVSTQFPMPSSWLFKVRKRATPTAIIYSPQTGASGGFYIQGLYDLAAGASAVGENLVGVVATGGTTVSPGSYCWYHAVADARL